MSHTSTTRELELEAQVAFLVAQIRAADSMLSDGDRDAALTQVRNMHAFTNRSYLNLLGRAAVRPPPPFDVGSACAAALERVTEFVAAKTDEAKKAFQMRCDAYGVEAGRDDHLDLLPYMERMARFLRPKAEAMYGVPPYMYGREAQGSFAQAAGRLRRPLSEPRSTEELLYEHQRAVRDSMVRSIEKNRRFSTIYASNAEHPYMRGRYAPHTPPVLGAVFADPAQPNTDPHNVDGSDRQTGKNIMFSAPYGVNVTVSCTGSGGGGGGKAVDGMARRSALW